jgi:ABC-type branched-subunit amino acid transport system substrate-binding protein
VSQGASKSAAPYKVEIISSLTGTGIGQGIPSADGFEAAFDAINASGGIKGHKISFQVNDDQSSTTVSAAAARTAVGANPIAIMDGSTTNYLSAREPVYESSNVTVFSTDATGLPFFPWLFSDGFTAHQGALAGVNSLKAVLGGTLTGKKIAFVLAASPGALAVAGAMSKIIATDGGSVTTQQQQPIGAPSFASGAANVLATHPDGVVNVDTAGDTIVEAKALDAAGYTGPFVGLYSAGDTSTFQAINSPNFYVGRAMDVAAPGNTLQKLAKKYGLTAGASSSLYGFGYVAGYTLAAGLQKCGYPCNGPGLQKALDALHTFNVPGKVTFAPFYLSPTEHSMMDTIQLFRWNSSKQQAVAFGKPFTAGLDDYKPV